MSDTSPVLSLPYLLPAQAQKHVTHNEALTRLDALVQLAVDSRSQSAPPSGPETGARHLVPAGATGAWAGQDHAIAVWTGALWEFTAPAPGWQAQVADEGLPVVFDGTAWAPMLQDLPGLGLGTGYDATNLLSVSGEATLLSHAGAGHRLKVNKAASAETATLLFQSSWSGRAELGLAGDEDFSIKVSPDGTTFTEALRVSPDTAITQARGLRSGTIDVAQDTVGAVPTPAAGGIVVIMVIDDTYPQTEHSGLYAYDAGASLRLTRLGAGTKIENLDNVALTGTSATDGFTGIAVQPGEIWLENRAGAMRRYAYTFLC